MSTQTNLLEANPSVVSVREWVLLPEEARVRGFRNALAFKRWCFRNGVAIRRDGRKSWVRSEDVDRAVSGMPMRGNAAAVTASVEAIKARRR
jgi:hypothetical protein